MSTLSESKEDVRAAKKTPSKARNPDAKYRVYTLVILIVLLCLWEAVPRLGLVNEILLPRFSAVTSAFVGLVSQPFFLKHFMTTFTEIIVGFVCGVTIGLTLGTSLALSKAVKATLYPFVVAIQATPKVVLAPLFVAWFGFGMESKIVMATVISFFPVLINTIVGLESVPEDSKMLMRSIRATRMQTFFRVSFPHALPIIFAGIRTAFVFAVIGAIVGEFIGASQGLGYLLNLYNFQLRIDRVFSVIVVLATFGAGGFFLLEWLDRKLIFWR